MKSMHVVIEGRVQGVAYRVWAERAAHDLRLAGWVRNRRDGTVEAVFAGDEDAVNSMIELCRLGSPAAYVTRITVTAFSGEAPEPPFAVLPTQ